MYLRLRPTLLFWSTWLVALHGPGRPSGTHALPSCPPSCLFTLSPCCLCTSVARHPRTSRRLVHAHGIPLFTCHMGLGDCLLEHRTSALAVSHDIDDPHAPFPLCQLSSNNEQGRQICLRRSQHIIFHHTRHYLQRSRHMQPPSTLSTTSKIHQRRSSCLPSGIILSAWHQHLPQAR